ARATSRSSRRGNREVPSEDGLREARAQIEAARGSVEHRPVGVAPPAAHRRVPRLGSNLEHATEVARDALEPAAPDEPRKLFPVEAQGAKLLLARRPEERRAHPPIS